MSDLNWLPCLRQRIHPDISKHSESDMARHIIVIVSAYKYHLSALDSGSPRYDKIWGATYKPDTGQGAAGKDTVSHTETQNCPHRVSHLASKDQKLPRVPYRNVYNIYHNSNPTGLQRKESDLNHMQLTHVSCFEGATPFCFTMCKPIRFQNKEDLKKKQKSPNPVKVKAINTEATVWQWKGLMGTSTSRHHSTWAGILERCTRWRVASWHAKE